jgi:Holliday junction resolvase
VTYDSAGSDTFVVTDATNTFKLHFKLTKNGLYALRGPSSDGQEKWLFVNTISDNKDMYIKREVKAAARAQ